MQLHLHLTAKVLAYYHTCTISHTRVEFVLLDTGKTYAII